MITRTISGLPKQIFRQIKKDFGDDVVVISCKTVSHKETKKQKKKESDLIEVVIAIDDYEAQTESNEIISKYEVIELDRSLEPQFTDNILELQDLLARNGIESHILKSIIDKYIKLEKDYKSSNDNLNISLLKNAVNELICCESTISHNRRIAIVGQHGVGKSTMTCKLAMRYQQVYRSSVGIISIDTDRISGIVQVEDICTKNNIPVWLATKTEDLALALDNFSNLDRIFIDCPGTSMEEIKISDMFSSLLSMSSIKKMLLIPASGNYIDIRNTIQRFSNYGALCISVTKIDDTSHFGPCFSAIADSQLGIEYFGNGRRIPEDLEVSSALRLTELITRTLH